jgi:glycosyltransferase involved in cell wall biosynthesis
LIEAQSQRLACISTSISAIPELIQKGVTGILSEPGDPAALSRAIAELIRDPARRGQFGRKGEARVRSLFAMEPGIDILVERFGLRTAGNAAVGRKAELLASALAADG